MIGSYFFLDAIAPSSGFSQAVFLNLNHLFQLAKHCSRIYPMILNREALLILAENKEAAVHLIWRTHLEE